MEAAIRRRFDVLSEDRVACLFRFVVDHAVRGPQGYSVARHVLDEERRCIADRTLSPAGLRIVALRPGP